jgi:hypothetical protein
MGLIMSIYFADHRSDINGDCRQPFWTFGISPRSYQHEKDDRGSTCIGRCDFFDLLNTDDAIFDSIRSGRLRSPAEAVSLTRKLDQNDRLTVEVDGAVARAIRGQNLFF